MTFSASFLILLVWLSLLHGRKYCNSVCPVGTLLGLISKVSVFKIKIDQKSCTSCGSCLRVCKAECIDLKNHVVDFSSCIACYNCINSCPESGIRLWYKISDKSQSFQKADVSKRAVLLGALFPLRTLFSFQGKGRGQRYGAGRTDVLEKEPERSCPVTAPGSNGIIHFTNSCTACHLCISACPTKVLQPALNEYGFEGILQPFLDFKTNYCEYDCTKCSEICPSGAILPITLEQKHELQIGKVNLIWRKCVVFTDRKDCGACAEVCPTQAVSMEEWRFGLKRPVIDQDICVGCGACEFACPTMPFKAIYVDGNQIHQLAKKPVKTTDQMEDESDYNFPF